MNIYLYIYEYIYMNIYIYTYDACHSHSMSDHVVPQNPLVDYHFPFCFMVILEG